MIPEMVKIGLREVTVVYAPLADGLLGTYDPNSLTITLSTKMQDPVLTMETFWHELIHAVNDKIRFDFELGRELATEQNIDEFVTSFNETFTESFSQTLMQVLKDNPLLPMAIPQG